MIWLKSKNLEEKEKEKYSLVKVLRCFAFKPAKGIRHFHCSGVSKKLGGEAVVILSRQFVINFASKVKTITYGDVKGELIDMTRAWDKETILVPDTNRTGDLHNT